jgi:hypothetical protein
MEEKKDIMTVARAFMRSRIILTAAELEPLEFFKRTTDDD